MGAAAAAAETAFAISTLVTAPAVASVTAFVIACATPSWVTPPAVAAATASVTKLRISSGLAVSGSAASTAAVTIACISCEETAAGGEGIAEIAVETTLSISALVTAPAVTSLSVSCTACWIWDVIPAMSIGVGVGWGVAVGASSPQATANTSSTISEITTKNLGFSNWKDITIPLKLILRAVCTGPYRALR